MYLSQSVSQRWIFFREIFIFTRRLLLVARQMLKIADLTDLLIYIINYIYIHKY